MLHFVATRFPWLLIAAFATALMSGPARASGEIGEHVKDLKSHINEYTDEVHWLIEQIDGRGGPVVTPGRSVAVPVGEWQRRHRMGAL